MLCLKWAQRVKINQDYKGTNPLQKWVFYQSFSCYPQDAPGLSGGLYTTQAYLRHLGRTTEPQTVQGSIITHLALKSATSNTATADSKVFSYISNGDRLLSTSIGLNCEILCQKYDQCNTCFVQVPLRARTVTFSFSFAFKQVATANSDLWFNKWNTGFHSTFTYTHHPPGNR